VHNAGRNAYRSPIPHNRAKNGDCPQFHNFKFVMVGGRVIWQMSVPAESGKAMP